MGNRILVIHRDVKEVSSTFVGEYGKLFSLRSTYEGYRIKVDFPCNGYLHKLLLLIY